MPASFSEISVEQGGTVRVETPAGGGYGDPLERDPARVLADVIAGKVTVEKRSPKLRLRRHRRSLKTFGGVVGRGGRSFYR